MCMDSRMTRVYLICVCQEVGYLVILLEHLLMHFQTNCIQNYLTNWKMNVRSGTSTWFVFAPRGATRKARGGIRLVHGLTKSTLITYYSGMKKDPKYAFLHAFFLICLSCSFQNLSIWPKTHPFFQFWTFLHP